MENKLNIKEYLDKDEQKDLLRLLTAGSEIGRAHV